MKLTDVKIGTRLVVAFATLLLVITAISGASVWRLRLIAHDTDQMEAASDNERVAQEWLRYTASNLVRTNAAARTTNAEDEKRFKDEIAATREQISQLQKRLEEVVDSGEGKLLMEKIAQRRKEYLTARDEVFKAKVPGMPEAAAAAAALIDDKLVPASKAYMASVEELSGHLKSEFMRTHDDLHALSANGQILLAGAWLVAVVLGTIFSWTLGRSITRPLKEAVQMAEAVAAGDLTTRVSYVSRDELGTLLHALGRMTESLLRIVNEVRSTTGSTVTAAREIATGNQDLSARTEQQASALEETASAMEELTSTVKQNADNANHANALASTASETAVKGGEVVTGVVQTMGSISDSSRKIVDIISVIDGIAFQTNILALNAAVEAARAGEQGRGFAVVAAEVRSLAQRSAGAAKEIKALIDDSVRKVEQGRELVDGAGQTMQEIVASVKRVTDVISEIAAASQEQTAGIEQINKAISQMDQVTQQNAALVEEAAAAAMSMQEQAVKLSHTVDVFKVESAGAPSALALSSRPAVPVKEAPRRIAASQDWEEF